MGHDCGGLASAHPEGVTVEEGGGESRDKEEKKNLTVFSSAVLVKPLASCDGPFSLLFSLSPALSHHSEFGNGNRNSELYD